MLYRHGARTPLQPYSNDPWRNESLWSEPFGQLTKVGKQQHLELGKWLRTRYDHMLPRKYSPHDIYVRSTNVDRTLMGAQVTLAGLYPPVDDQIFDAELKWIPIPVHVIPQGEENLFYGGSAAAKNVIEALNDCMLSKMQLNLHELFDYLTPITGMTIDNPVLILHVYNTLFSEDSSNKTLPAWTKSLYPDPLVQFSLTFYKCLANYTFLPRISGLLVKEMVAHMIKKSENALAPDRKLFMYSAHGETVTGLLGLLGFVEFLPPPYVATVLIELRLNSKNEHVVTMSYKNLTGEPTLLTLPGCTTACPLVQFRNLTNYVIPEDRNKE